MSGPISPWQRRDNFSVARHQQLVDGINQVSAITPAGELESWAGTNARSLVDVAQHARILMVRVRIVSAAVRGGCYNGALLTIPAPENLLTDGVGQFDDENVGVPFNSTTPDTFVLNAQERASNSHGLTINAASPIFCHDFPGEYIGVNSDGKHVVVINGFNIRFC